MRILILLLTSMLFYACGNGNFFNDEPYNGLDLATECGCYDFFRNKGSIKLALGYDDYDDYEKQEEWGELIKKCDEVVKVFDDEELKTKLIDVERKHKESGKFLSYEEAVEILLSGTDYFKDCREKVIDVPYWFVSAHDPEQEIIDGACGYNYDSTDTN